MDEHHRLEAVALERELFDMTAKLLLDDRGRRVAAAVIERPSIDRFAVDNSDFAELILRDEPNVIVDRTGRPDDGR